MQTANARTTLGVRQHPAAPCEIDLERRAGGRRHGVAQPISQLEPTDLGTSIGLDKRDNMGQHMSRQMAIYRRISEALEDEIRGGQLGVGDQLPAENDLARRFGVSRMTVRQALAELARKRLITTRAGSGSYITFDDQQLDWRQGWSRALAIHGARIESRVLRFGPIEDAALAERFGTAAEFIALDRVRLLDGRQPISLERSRIPLVERTQSLLDVDFARESLMDAMRRAGLVPASSEEWIEVAQLTTDEARALDRAIGEGFLLSRRVTRDAQGALIEHVTSLLDPAHFRLHITFDLGPR